jgi:hypothetical protein
MTGEEKAPPRRPCEGCRKNQTELEKKLDDLIGRLNPLIEFAQGFMESPSGKLYRAMTRRKTGGAG